MSPWRDWLPFGKVPELSAEQLAERLNEVQLLDVRTRREFLAGHISGARHLAITALNHGTVAALQLDQRRPVVAICRSAHRSIPATRQLIHMGFEAYQLAGGMKEWWGKNLPTDEKGYRQ